MTAPGFRLTGQACHRFPARRGDGKTPSATFAHIAFLAYLGSVRGYERAGFTAVTRRQRSFPPLASRRVPKTKRSAAEPDELRAAAQLAGVALSPLVSDRNLRVGRPVSHSVISPGPHGRVPSRCGQVVLRPDFVRSARTGRSAPATGLRTRRPTSDFG